MGACRWPGLRRRTRSGEGFTLLELMLAIGVLGVLLVLATGAYGNFAERARVNEAINQIQAMSASISGFALINGRYPEDLGEMGYASSRDPWGHAFVYTDLTGRSRGAARKDRRLNPLNSDFDLFSPGRDGTYRTQITHRTSLDDVIRARDGAFVDLASKF